MSYTHADGAVTDFDKREPSHTEPMPALDTFDKIEIPSNPWRIEPKLIGEGLRPDHHYGDYSK